MAINKKLIHFKTKSNFEKELANGNILDSSICFIKETKEIWTHGQLYNCSGSYTETDPVFVGSPAYNIKSTDISNWNSKTSNTGTVTGVKVNGTTKSPSNGVVDLGTVITTYQTLKTINGESIVGGGDISLQEKLTSGTNIKTINGASILGSGDITIGGGSSSGLVSGVYPEVNHGSSDTTFTLTSNTFHVWDEVRELTLTLGDETAGVTNEYLFQFTSGSEPTTLTLPDGIIWVNDNAPAVVENKIYQISILKGLAVILEFEAPIMIITFYIDNTKVQALPGMTWKEWGNSEFGLSYLSINDKGVLNNYNSKYIYTPNGVKVKGTDIIEQISYTYTNPWI